VVMTASQYWQQRQINQRNPAAANANPQMKLTMQMFPAIYALISFRIPAAVVLYLLLSGLFRMAQNSISYRFDPVLARAATPPDKAIDATSRPKVGAGAGAKGIGSGAKAVSAGSKGSSGTAKAALSSGKTGRVTPKPDRPTASGGKGAGKAAPPQAPAKPGSFMERLRAQAAEAKAQADQARSTNGANGKGADRGQPANGKAAGKSNGNSAIGTGRDRGEERDEAPLPLVDEPVDEPVDTQWGDEEFAESDSVGEADVEADAAEEQSDDDAPPGRAAASPLSIRPSGRRPKKDR